MGRSSLVVERPHVPRSADVTITLPANSSSAAVARQFVRHVLETSRHGALEDAALLCVTELVANVSRHTRSTSCVIRLVDEPDDLLIEVADDASDLPVLGPLPVRTESGRGLHIINALAGEWGVRRQVHAGKCVWLRLCDS
jgi:anti-sigma regulatory factor (Ser/Thr protein kinase)